MSGVNLQRYARTLIEQFISLDLSWFATCKYACTLFLNSLYSAASMPLRRMVYLLNLRPQLQNFHHKYIALFIRRRQRNERHSHGLRGSCYLASITH